LPCLGHDADQKTANVPYNRMQYKVHLYDICPSSALETVPNYDAGSENSKNITESYRPNIQKYDTDGLRQNILLAT
jgi:hypothetical protein